MKKRILIIVENLDPDNSSGAKANLAFVENLIELDGYDTYVAHYTRKQIVLDHDKLIDIKEKRVSIKYFLSKLQQKLQSITGININSYIEKIWGFSLAHQNDVYSIYWNLRNQIDLINPDLVITLSQASSFRPHKAMLQLPAYHSRWLAYIHDPYPMHCYPRPYDWIEPGHHQKYIFMREVCHKATYLGFPSLYLARWMSTYYFDFKHKRFSIIPHQISNWLNKSDIILPDPFSFFNNSNNFLILHAGSMMDARNPIHLINGFISFLKKNDLTQRTDIKLIFIGKKSIYHSIIQSIQKNYPQIVISEDYINTDIALALQQHASANVILEGDAMISPFLPGKFPHCVIADRPILYLGPKMNETIRLLGKDYPYQSEIDDPQGIADVIELLFKTWIQQGSRLNLGRPDLVEYLGKSFLANQIKSLMQL